jgi:hypothetical protein
MEGPDLSGLTVGRTLHFTHSRLIGYMFVFQSILTVVRFGGCTLGTWAPISV